MADDSFPTSRSSALPAERPTRVLAGRYEVLAEIGSGATAVTYRGRDQRLDRRVAIKLMRRDHELDPTFVRRFEREARVAASVSHGNVVDVYDVGQDDGDLYIVMQYVDGDDLKELIGREGALPVSRATEITRQVLAGLGAIHLAGIIHRDIKLQNVLVGRDGIARVTDFGIAQIAMDVGLTTAGTTVGTAAYMAPEQAQGGQVTEATDLYAVGVMLYEMLTGQMPFEAPTPMALMLAHIQREPDPPSTRLPEGAIPPELDAVVMQAMAKDPADRFRSAAAMARALGGTLNSSRQTTVLSSALPRRTSVAEAARPAEWPQRPAPTRPAHLAPASGSRAGAGLRGVLGALLLLLLLGIAGVAGYVAYGMVTDDDADEAPAVVDATATATATAAESAPTVTPTDEPDPTDEPAPTEVPIVAPTATDVPDPTATSAPVPTATLMPTEVPTVPPTDVPTEVPEPTATEPGSDPPVIEPADGQDDTSGGSGDGQGEEAAPTQAAGDAQAPAAIDSSQIQPIDSGQSGSSTGSVQSGDAAASGQAGSWDLPPDEWKGGGSRYDKDQGWVEVAPGESATARFDVDAIPAGDTFTIEIDMTVTGSGQVPLAFLLNGQELRNAEGSSFVLKGTGNGNQLGTVTITLPTAPLVEGKNEITIVNGATDRAEGGNGNGNGNGNNAKLEDDTLLLAGATVSLDG